MEFYRLANGARFEFKGKQFTKIAMSMAEDVMCLRLLIPNSVRQGIFLLATAVITMACPALGGLPGGSPIWTNRYRGTSFGSCVGRALACDFNGNVFVTGYAGGGSANADWVTLAYSAKGVALWTNYYAGPGNGNDFPNAIAVKTGGQVVVTGSSDGGTNTYRDFLTVAYSAAGTPLWTNRYSSPGTGVDIPVAVAVATNGSVVVTGHEWVGGEQTSSACVTIAYSSVGVPLWTNRYRGPANGSDSGNAIAVSGTGNAFVTGTSAELGSGLDLLTVAYSPAGTGLWTNRFNGPGNGDDVASSIAVDAYENVFVTGRATGASGNTVCVTIAYSGSGAPLWTNVYQGPGTSAFGRAVAADQSHVLVAGFAGDATGYDFITLAYSKAGEPLWTNRYNGPANDDDEAFALALDGGDNAIVTGESRGSNLYDYATVAYSVDSGLSIWTNRYDGQVGGQDESLALCVDLDGNVFVTGQSFGPAGDFDIVTIKYSSSARPLLQCWRDAGQAILSWGRPAFTLQSAPTVGAAFTNIPGATSPYTNRISSPKEYFRLINR
jgi:hypothetical protein